jgi:hypothetical protein
MSSRGILEGVGTGIGLDQAETAAAMTIIKKIILILFMIKFLLSLSLNERFVYPPLLRLLNYSAVRVFFLPTYE